MFGNVARDTKDAATSQVLVDVAVAVGVFDFVVDLVGNLVVVIVVVVVVVVVVVEGKCFLFFNSFIFMKDDNARRLITK